MFLRSINPPPFSRRMALVINESDLFRGGQHFGTIINDRRHHGPSSSLAISGGSLELERNTLDDGKRGAPLKIHGDDECANDPVLTR